MPNVKDETVKIDGKTYDGVLIKIADGAVSPIGWSTAEALWDEALDGSQITDLEKRTLLRVLEKHTWEDGPKEFLEYKLALHAKGCPGHLAPVKHQEGKSQYKTIKGEKYELDLLNLAVAKTSSGKFISLEGAKEIYAAAMDGNKVTTNEWRTLEYIVAHYRHTADAHGFLMEKLKADQKGSGGVWKFEGVACIVGQKAGEAPAAATSTQKTPEPVASKPATTPAKKTPEPAPTKGATTETDAKKRKAEAAELEHDRRKKLGEEKKRKAAEAALNMNVCWDFVYGHCSRGDTCKFKHEGEVADVYLNSEHARSLAAQHDLDLDEEAIEELGTLHEDAIDDMIEGLAPGGEHEDVTNKSRFVAKNSRRKRAEMAKSEHEEWKNSKAPKRFNGKGKGKRNGKGKGKGKANGMWMFVPDRVNIKNKGKRRF